MVDLFILLITELVIACILTAITITLYERRTGSDKTRNLFIFMLVIGWFAVAYTILNILGLTIYLP